MEVEIETAGRALVGTFVLAALTVLSGCGDGREYVVGFEPVVLVVDTKVLKDYSLRTGEEWKQMALNIDSVNFGERNWIAHPPAGILLKPGSKITVLGRRFLQPGELVESYAANSYDMQRNLAVEVLFVEVQHGQQRQLQGWLPHYCCRPAVLMP